MIYKRNIEILFNKFERRQRDIYSAKRERERKETYKIKENKKIINEIEKEKENERTN